MRPPLPRGPQGFTLIEAMISMVVLLVALLAMAELQVVTTRANRFGDRMAQASAMATDLSENISRWSYADTRLTAASTVTSPAASTIAARWDMGRGATASYVADYGSAVSDANAATANALPSTYQGLSADVNRDSTPDFYRYWNVYAVDPTGTGTPQGKFIQIIVRWKEAGVGYRQITASAYKRNPASGILE